MAEPKLVADPNATGIHFFDSRQVAKTIRGAQCLRSGETELPERWQGEDPLAIRAAFAAVRASLGLPPKFIPLSELGAKL